MSTDDLVRLVHFSQEEVQEMGGDWEEFQRLCHFVRTLIKLRDGAALLHRIFLMLSTDETLAIYKKAWEDVRNYERLFCNAYGLTFEEG